MATQQDIPINDDELDSLMAELEAETSGAVVAPPPVVAAAPAPVAEDDELAALDAELAEVDTTPPPAPAPEPEPTPEPQPEPAPEPVVDPMNTDDELAALEAELAATTAAAPAPAPAPALAPRPVPKPAPAPVPEPEPEPTPEPKPEPKPVLKAVPTPPPEELPVAPPNPLPKKEPAGLQFFIDVAQFRDETRVAEHNLDNAMMQQAGLRAYYSEQAARAEAQHSRLKARFKVLEAQLYDQHRKALIASGEKVTEKAVENAVLMDAKWIKNQNVVIEAETIASINRGLVDSLRDRKDMLVQLGADRREEGKGQLRVMAANQAHDDNKARAMRAAQ